MITVAYIEGIKEIPQKYDYIEIFWKNDEDEFGNIYLYSYPNGSIEIDSEHMGKEFVKEVFNKLVKDAALLE